LFADLPNGDGPEVSPDLRPQLGVIEACLGTHPEQIGLDPQLWAARIDFMTLTAYIFYFVYQSERLSLAEVNEVRKLTLRWGRAFILSGFPESRWTSYFHVFHEHVYWELKKFFFLFLPILPLLLTLLSSPLLLLPSSFSLFSSI
jgi:hypothetical protein